MHGKKTRKRTCFALYNVTLYWAYKRQTAVLTNYLFLVPYAVDLELYYTIVQKNEKLGFKNTGWSGKAIYSNKKRQYYYYSFFNSRGITVRGVPDLFTASNVVLAENSNQKKNHQLGWHSSYLHSPAAQHDWRECSSVYIHCC